MNNNLIGTIWKAPNFIWRNGFAKNKSGNGLHPMLVEKERNDGLTAFVIPGTSKVQKGSCVFRIKLAIFSKKKSNFILKLRMTEDINFIKTFSKGWDNVKKLNEKQLDELRWQENICFGKN